MMADSYVPIFFDWPEATRALSAQEKGRLIDALVVYARQGEGWQELVKGNERFAFPIFQAQIDRSRVEREVKLRRDRENGKKGGRRKASASAEGSDGGDGAAGDGAADEEGVIGGNPGFEGVSGDEAGLEGVSGENPGFEGVFPANPDKHEDEYDHEYEYDIDRQHRVEGDFDEEEDRGRQGEARAGAGACAREIEEAWRREFGRVPNPAIVRGVLRWARFYRVDDFALVLEAVSAAALRDANDPLAYVIALFRDWRERGVRGVEDLE